jgi:antitoxin component HigA of HigAB toxin-antitoxin module
LIEHGAKSGSGWRLPAGQLERAVQQALAALLSDRLQLVRCSSLTPSRDCFGKTLATAEELAEFLKEAPQPKASIISLGDRVTLHADDLDLAPSSASRASWIERRL